MEEECVEMYGMSGTFFTADDIQIPTPCRNERNFHPLPDMLTDSGSEFDDEVAEFSYATATAEDADAERECLLQHHHRLPKSWTVIKSTLRLC